MALVLVIVGAIAGYGTTSQTPPPSAAAMHQTGARQHPNAAGLTNGRALFLNRCARCHTLPAAGKHKAEDWPRIVAKMSKRSGLKEEQSKSILAYILATRAAAPR